MRIANILLFSMAIVPAAVSAADVGLTKGRLTQDGPFVEQPIAAKNNSNHAIDWLSVECGFFQGGSLTATGMNNARQIASGQTAYFNVVAKAANIDSAECRVSREDE